MPASSSKTLKLGVIGCGRVAETRHLPALQTLPDVEVVAVADISPDRLRWVADRFHIKARYPDGLALLDNSAIEAVAVCVPTQFHVEVALAALDTGKHLFIEKPLALSLDESDRLIERAKQSSNKVMLGFNMRWHRLLRQARQIIQEGTLGSLKLMCTTFTSGTRYRGNVPEWRKQRMLGGGVLIEQAVHHFDLWRFLLQSEVEEVFATSHCGQWEDETATVTARMANGVLVAAMFSEGTSDNNEVEVYGQAGRLRVSCYRFDGLEFSSAASVPGAIRTRLHRTAQALKALPLAVSQMRRGGDYIASYRAEWRHFLDCVQHDTPVECTLDDGRCALQVVLAALESASLRQPVNVSQGPREITPMAASTPVERQQRP
ncbi:MAG: Gfo/Idh/MocA family oxidoreductase [Deltaproteobacteria bacterium]|nr:Gfo/Idh/MocA family oxidoreductase [Deltaproteobacteria bacterium]